MSQFGEFARWFSKRLITGIVLLGVGLAAWNWKHQGEENEVHAATHDEPKSPKTEPQDCQSRAEGLEVVAGTGTAAAAARAETQPLAPPSHPPVPKMANDQWPENIRQLGRQDQRRRLYIYLPPNISREEAERW